MLSALLCGNWGYFEVYFLCFPVVCQASTHRIGMHSTMAQANGEQAVRVWPVCAGSACMGSQMAFKGLG